jgi:hypothetical protein
MGNLRQEELADDGKSFWILVCKCRYRSGSVYPTAPNGFLSGYDEVLTYTLFLGDSPGRPPYLSLCSQTRLSRVLPISTNGISPPSTPH